MNWLNEIQDSIDYIEEHLQKEIAKTTLCSFLNEPYDLYQRIFTILCGITPMQYIRYRRLSEAALRIRNSNERILTIALSYGYENEESFRKAFTRFHHCTPAKARTTDCVLQMVTPIKIQIDKKGASALTYRIVELPALTLQSMPQHFSSIQESYRQAIPDFWKVFFTTAMYQEFCKLCPYAHIFTGKILGVDTIAFDQEKDTITYAAAIASATSIAECIPLQIPAHTWIAFAAQGTMPKVVHRLWTQIYNEFFPHSMYEPVIKHHLEVYDPVHKDQIEIYIPVRKKDENET